MLCSERSPRFSHVRPWSQDGDIGTVELWEVVPQREAATKVTRVMASKEIMGCGFHSFASLG